MSAEVSDLSEAMRVRLASGATQVVKAIEAGVDNYIAKPFTPETVKEKLEAVYQKRNG